MFYTNVCGNVEQEYTRDELDSQLKHEFISALQPAFGKLSDLGLRPNQIVAHNTELEDAMNTALSAKWGELRGLTVVSIALGSVTLPDEDAEMIKQAQRTAMMRDPTMAAATLVGAQSDAMKTAAGNSAGAMNGFMGCKYGYECGRHERTRRCTAWVSSRRRRLRTAGSARAARWSTAISARTAGQRSRITTAGPAPAAK